MVPYRCRTCTSLSVTGNRPLHPSARPEVWATAYRDIEMDQTKHIQHGEKNRRYQYQMNMRYGTKQRLRACERDHDSSVVLSLFFWFKVR
jgi:hypothetical protein